jgi:hypothetical protein
MKASGSRHGTEERENGGGDASECKQWGGGEGDATARWQRRAEASEGEGKDAKSTEVSAQGRAGSHLFSLPFSILPVNARPPPSLTKYFCECHNGAGGTQEIQGGAMNCCACGGLSREQPEDPFDTMKQTHNKVVSHTRMPYGYRGRVKNPLA